MIVTWLNRIGVFGLGLFALFSLFKTAPAHIGIALALPAAFVGAWQLRRQRWSSATRITLVLATWLCLRFALQGWGGMVETGLYDQKAVFIDWLFVPMFALLAAVPTDDPVARLRTLWLLAGAGFLVGILSFLWSTGFLALWSGKRLAFHLDRALGIGLYAGCLAIALIATARLWWRHQGALRWPLRILGIALIGLFLQVVISTQNRSNMLGFGVLIICAAGYWLIHILRHDDARAKRRLLVVGVVAAVVAGAAITMNFGAISARFVMERKAMTAVLDKGLENAPAASVTVRLRLWQYVLERFPDAPVIGHGFGDLRDVIDRDLRPRGGLIASERYDHVHSSYFQTLWTQGLVGIALWSALSLILILDAVRAARHNRRVSALMPAMWGILIYTAVWAAFDYRLSHPDMRFFTLLLLLSLRLMGQAGSPSTRDFR
jgi:O-antigen ligase